MDHRIGTCGACRARYQIPASFPHSRAKCRSCGGTVEIGPIVSATAAANVSKSSTPVAPTTGTEQASTRDVAPTTSQSSTAPSAESPLARPERAGLAPGRERSEASRADTRSSDLANGPVGRPNGVATPNAATARQDPHSNTVEPKTTANRDASASSHVPTELRPATPTQPAATESETPRAERSASNAAREVQARGRTPSEARPTRGERPTEAPARPRSKLVPVTLLALLLAGGGLAAFWLLHDRAEDPTLAAAPAAGGPGDANAEATRGKPSAPTDSKSTAPTPADSGSQASARDGSASNGSTSATAALRALDAALLAAPDIELTLLPDLVTDELRASESGRRLDQALATFLVTDDAAVRAPAAKELVAAGRAALPFVVDAWKRLDPSVAADRERATRIERELATPLARGRGFGWSDDTDAASERGNRKVIAQWHALAMRLDSDDAWRQFVEQR